MKKTKIVCTIGPASWHKDTLAQMYQAGMNAARLNASFADTTDIREFIKMVRNVSPNIAAILDAKGHKIRLNQFRKPIILKENEEFVLNAKPKKGTIYTTYKDLAKDVKKGSTILIDDGRIELEVTDIVGDKIITRVEQGGELKKGKSVNVPGTHLQFPPLTDKDFEDINLAVELKYDYVAASFIRNIEDVFVIKKLLNGSRTKLIAKIEDSEGVANFDSILNEVDGIMIARGDLGVEIPAEKVPILQKQFIKKCRLHGKPVIVATHMLESMVSNSHPTRAEVNDVANSVYDGADALMLSAETSTGKYPIKATKKMAQIAREVENHVPPRIIEANPNLAKPVTNAIARAVVDICENLPIDKILVATATGATAVTISRHLPRQSIFAFTRDEVFVRKLALYRGIESFVMESASTNRDLSIKNVIQCASQNDLVSESDLVVIVAGANILGQGSTNMLEVQRVGHFTGEFAK